MPPKGRKGPPAKEKNIHAMMEWETSGEWESCNRRTGKQQQADERKAMKGQEGSNRKTEREAEDRRKGGNGMMKGTPCPDRRKPAISSIETHDFTEYIPPFCKAGFPVLRKDAFRTAKGILSPDERAPSGMRKASFQKPGDGGGGRQWRQTGSREAKKRHFIGIFPSGEKVPKIFLKLMSLFL